MTDTKSSAPRPTTPRDYKWKYRGQNPLERLHQGEPYFFIRAQDSLSSEAVQAYADLLKREQSKAFAAGDEDLANSLLKQSLAVLSMSNSFMDWQADNPDLVKKPRIRHDSVDAPLTTEECRSILLAPRAESVAPESPRYDKATIDALIAELEQSHFTMHVGGGDLSYSAIGDWLRSKRAGAPTQAAEAITLDDAMRFEQLRQPRPQTNREIWEMMADFATQCVEAALRSSDTPDQFRDVTKVITKDGK